MPAEQRGQAIQLGPKRWALRWYDRDGVRRKKSGFTSKSTALAHYRDVIRPELTGEATTDQKKLTFSEFVDLYLERHAANVRPRTIATLRERLGHAESTFQAIPLSDLSKMASDIAAWSARQPERVRYGRMGALRQCLGAAVQWEYINKNPAKAAGPNRQPSPRTIRAFDRDELDAIALELPPIYEALPVFVASTGLRPEEWQALERRDVDRRAGHLVVARTISSGVLTDLAKTTRSRRQVPLSRRAVTALDLIPARLDTPLLFPSPGGGHINIDNFRRRQWGPAIEASGVQKPARIYDLRSTFASDALAAGVSVFELARIMGTSVSMIERHYGALLDGAGAGIAARLDFQDAERDRTLRDVRTPIGPSEPTS